MRFVGDNSSDNLLLAELKDSTLLLTVTPLTDTLINSCSSPCKTKGTLLSKQWRSICIRLVTMVRDGFNLMSKSTKEILNAGGTYEKRDVAVLRTAAELLDIILAHLYHGIIIIIVIFIIYIIYIYICVCVCMYVCMYCVCVCVYIYIYIAATTISLLDFFKKRHLILFYLLLTC